MQCLVEEFGNCFWFHYSLLQQHMHTELQKGSCDCNCYACVHQLAIWNSLKKGREREREREGKWRGERESEGEREGGRVRER